MKDIILQTFLDHQQVLFNEPEVETTVRTINGLAYDLFKSKGEELKIYLTATSGLTYSNLQQRLTSFIAKRR